MDETKIQNYIKQVRDEANVDMKNHIGALIEQVDDRFKATSESVMLLNNKIDRIEKTLESHTEMIGTLMEDVTHIKDSVENHDSRITAVEAKV